jgi:superfamily II DNA or RNA helicase
MNLYPYQSKAVTDLRNGFKSYVGQILQAPTGAGKTVMFSEIVRLSQIKGSTVLILTDRKELFRQISNTLKAVGVIPELINAQSSVIGGGSGVFVCMVETLARREHILSSLSPSLIIIDECHKGNFNKIIDLFPSVPRIGATATPMGKHIPIYYQNIVQTIDVPDLVTAGFLVRCRSYQMQDDFSDLRKQMGEFTDKSQFTHFDKAKLYDGVIDKYRETYSGKKAICFNINIKHTEKMHQAFLDAGIKSACITSKTTDSERDSILAEYHNFKGEFVLNNCGVLTTGYDEPTIECVILNRATDSLALYLQMVGRGSRICEGKNEFGMLDFGGNISRHGLWSQPRTWTLDQTKRKKSDKLDVFPVKSCPKCSAMLSIMARTCEFCGQIFDMENKKLLNGVLVEVEPDTITGKLVSELSVAELHALSKQKRDGFSAHYIWRVVRSRGEDMLREYSVIAGYSSGWVWAQSQKLDDCQHTNKRII